MPEIEPTLPRILVMGMGVPVSLAKSTEGVVTRVSPSILGEKSKPANSAALYVDPSKVSAADLERLQQLVTSEPGWKQLAVHICDHNQFIAALRREGFRRVHLNHFRTQKSAAIAHGKMLRLKSLRCTPGTLREWLLNSIHAEEIGYNKKAAKRLFPIAAERGLVTCTNWRPLALVIRGLFREAGLMK